MDTLTLENATPQNYQSSNDDSTESLAKHMRSALLETKAAPKACYLELYFKQLTSVEEELSA